MTGAFPVAVSSRGDMRALHQWMCNVARGHAAKDKDCHIIAILSDRKGAKNLQAGDSSLR